MTYLVVKCVVDDARDRAVMTHHPVLGLDLHFKHCELVVESHKQSTKKRKLWKAIKRLP